MKRIILVIMLFLVVNVFSKDFKDSPFNLDLEREISILFNTAQIYNVYSIRNNAVKNNFENDKFSVQFMPGDFWFSSDEMLAVPYDDTTSTLSDLLQGVLIISQASLLVNKDLEEMATIAVMYAETMLLSNALVRLTKVSIDRPRPYTYFLEPGESSASSTNSQNSFYSAHTTMAFTNAAFLTTVFNAYYPDSNLKTLVSAGSFGVASVVGILRITSGNHYVSDVLVGAAVGSFFGWLVPTLHKEFDEGGPIIRLYTDDQFNLGLNLIISI